MPPRRAPVAGEVQDGGSPFGELGAKNLLLRRRTPLSPLATNWQHAGGSASGSAAALGGVAALGAAAAGMLPRSTDGLRVCSAPEAGFRSPGALLSVGVPGASPGRQQLAANRSRVQNEVDEALSEIHESITELATLLSKDDTRSQVAATAPSQGQPARPIVEEGDRTALGGIDFDELADLSCDLSVSYSLLGKSRSAGAGRDGGCDDASAPLAADGDGDNKMDLTDLSMNLSQDPEVPVVSYVGLV